MWRNGDFARLRRRRSADRWLIFEALLWLGLARAAVLGIPFHWTTWLFRLRPGEAAEAVEPYPTEIARRIGWALRVASSRSPWRSTCLAQALAGFSMLRRRRVPSTLALGVARSASDSLEAHAWLSCGGFILTGAGGCERFSVVARYTMPGRLDRA
jgi:hypothetical protein